MHTTFTLPNWMSYLEENITINQIMMPGSHDAGMSETHYCNPSGGTGRALSRTQKDTIKGQLNSGSRYFDIRIDYHKGKLVTYHRFGSLGCDGQSLEDVFDDAISFLNKYTSETIIFKISHIRNYFSHIPKRTKAILNSFLKDYDFILYKNTDYSIKIPELALKEVRGKLILVFDYDEYIDPISGKFRYIDMNAYSYMEHLIVYDKYSNTESFTEMKKDQLKKWDTFAGINPYILFLLSWTLTFSGTTASIRMLAAKANARLSKTLYDQIIINGANKPNIVYIDFVSKSLCQDIIKYNFIS